MSFADPLNPMSVELWNRWVPEDSARGETKRKKGKIEAYNLNFLYLNESEAI